MLIDYKGYKCKVVFGLYVNGNIAIRLIGAEGTEYAYEPITVATVNTGHITEDNVVGIKTWSENEGIVKSLVDGKVIENEMQYLVPTGYVYASYYKLTEQALKELEKLKSS